MEVTSTVDNSNANFSEFPQQDWTNIVDLAKEKIATSSASFNLFPSGTGAEVLTSKEKNHMYVLHKLVGKGLYKRAYESASVSCSEQVQEAVRTVVVLKSDYSKKKYVLGICQREVLLLKQFNNHPRFVSVYLHGEILDQSIFFSVVEKMDGHLGHYIKHYNMTEDRMCSIAYQVAEVVKALNFQHWVNFDWKVSNVLYSLETQNKINIKIGDLNSTKKLNEDYSAPASHDYAAPEQLFALIKKLEEKFPEEKAEEDHVLDFSEKINSWGMGGICYTLLQKKITGQFQELPTATQGMTIYNKCLLPGNDPKTTYGQVMELFNGFKKVWDTFSKEETSDENFFMKEFRKITQTLLYFYPKERSGPEAVMQRLQQLGNQLISGSNPPPPSEPLLFSGGKDDSTDEVDRSTSSPQKKKIKVQTSHSQG